MPAKQGREPVPRIRWGTAERLELLKQYNAEFDMRLMKNPLPPIDWDMIARTVSEKFGTTRTPLACKARLSKLLGNLVFWQRYEDEALDKVVAYIYSLPRPINHSRWYAVSRALRYDHEIARSPEACRVRYRNMHPGGSTNVLPPRKSWPQAESDSLLALVDSLPDNPSTLAMWEQVAEMHNAATGARRTCSACRQQYKKGKQDAADK